MRKLRRLALGAGLAVFGASPSLAQLDRQIPVIDGPTYTMTYLEVVPSATAQALNLLKDYRDASRKEQGAMFVEIYQEQGQSHRFVLREIWQNRGAAAAHGNAAAMNALAQKLKPVELGPIDTRIHQANAVTQAKAPNPNDVFIISHVDVAGGNTQNLINQLGTLGEASRKENGMAQYEILDEVPAHSNHFRTFEEWTSMAAFEAHDRAPQTQTFRNTVLQWLGTPYDQRIYKLVN